MLRPMIPEDPVRHPRPPLAPAIRWWIYVLAWVPCLAITAVAFFAMGARAGQAVPGALATTLPQMLLGVAVLRLPRRLRWTEGPLARPVATLAGAGVVFVLASTAGWIGLVALDGVRIGRRLSLAMTLTGLPWRVLTDILIFGVLVGFASAREYAALTRHEAARAARAETLRARAELAALRSQLNPHFILNTYHALVGLVGRDPRLAETGLERLGDLLRYSLRVQSEALDEVLLREEMAFVGTYVDLERLRLGERLRLSIAADDEALDTPVPPFAVQTLVENAIRHAIAVRAEGGILAIAARRADGRLRIEVTDDGPGATAAGQGATAASQGATAPSQGATAARQGAGPANSGHGIGLRLLEERLRALYGDGARVALAPLPAGGTRALLDLPAPGDEA